MFADKMQLGLLALLCSYAVATQPAELLKQQAAHASHKQDSLKAVTMAESAKKHKEAISHLRKSSVPTAERKEKDPNAVSGLVKGLAAVPTKGGKVVPGFAKRANHPSVRALHPKPQDQQAKHEIRSGKPVSEPKPVAKEVPKAKPAISASKPVANTKPMAHQKKVSKPKTKEDAKPVAKAKHAVHPSEAKHVVQQPKVTNPKPVAKEHAAKNAAPQHPALVARAYPSLVPIPPKRSSIPTAAVSTSTETDAERAQKVQRAFDDSEKAMKEVDQDIEESKREASEAHKLAHAK